MYADCWAYFEGAVVSPLAANDADLVAKLTDLFLHRLVLSMTVEERVYALGLEPPRFELGVTPAHGRLLGVRHGGRHLVLEWDGTPFDAGGIVAILVENFALYSQLDFWAQEEGRTEGGGRGVL